MCLAFSSDKPRFKPASRLLDQVSRVEPVVFPKSKYECVLHLVFYTIIALVSLGCLSIITLSGKLLVVKVRFYLLDRKVLSCNG